MQEEKTGGISLRQRNPQQKRLTPASKPVVAAGWGMKVSDEQRYRMVAEAAYYRAESNQFKSDPLRD